MDAFPINTDQIIFIMEIVGTIAFASSGVLTAKHSLKTMIEKMMVALRFITRSKHVY